MAPAIDQQHSRSSRPNNHTIHGFAQSGDLASFSRLLKDNPSLLNERNPVMAQTPLHVAAGYNKVEIVKLLLNWKGQEKVELEAKNMYGETPLHMAAKNGCNEAAKLLLSHGAFVEAKANDGMAPMNHLASGPGNEKLRQLLNQYSEEQRKRKAVEACSQTKAKMDELEQGLSNIVGLNELKLQLRKWARGMLLDERRRALGLKVGPRRPPHMAFLGNPGTGKTMVARILGKLLFMVGILPTDKVTEVQRTDLVGEFVGHTGPKTRKVIKEAEGGILFVDEAYRLIPMQKSDDKDYGLEALEEIMSVMDNGKIVVIFAGYSEPMKRVISSNEGFCRRVTKFFQFDDFTSKDLANIAHIKMNNQIETSLLYGFKLHSSCTLDSIASLIERETTNKQRQEMNGGLVDPMLVNARENLDLRLSFDCMDSDELLTITLEDLEVGLRCLSR
ncbi:ribulose bisphosphate carboxylase/oxygenase activase, chloroplastic isoform X2 [Silene latifolia]|uniref:ribulose bisphosphate carboxylase/oxygenase activase, chloroplastic isoform X2 n=1 Tax=Silene latifolia TaxID=37657 RepID=UPI003D7860EF